MEEARQIIRLDLRGDKCPINWARSKAQLELMGRGELLELLLDDPRSIRDLPRAAEAEGHSILEIAPENGFWRVVIEK